MIVFLDMEASSLAPDSWPVEVGLAWVTGGRVEVRSSLVRPEFYWSLRAWSRVSARVHGVALDELRRAPPAPQVARWAAGIVGDATLVSDAPEWDLRWLARLYETAEGLRVPRVVDFDALVASRLTLAQSTRVHAALDQLPAPQSRGTGRRPAGPGVARRPGDRLRPGDRRLKRVFGTTPPHALEATRAAARPREGESGGSSASSDPSLEAPMPDFHVIQFPTRDRPRCMTVRFVRGDVIAARWPWPGAMTREGYAHRPCLVLDVEARGPDVVMRLAPGVSAIERPPQGLDLGCTARELRGVREVEEPMTFVLGRSLDLSVTHPALARDGDALVRLGRQAPEVTPRLNALVARLDAGLELMGGGRRTYPIEAASMRGAPARRRDRRSRATTPPGTAEGRVVRLVPRATARRATRPDG